MSLNNGALSELLRIVGARNSDNVERVLEASLRLLGKWRSQLISNAIVVRDGRHVQSGPFAGMNYSVSASEGALAPRLLGTYEAELHAPIRALIEDGVDDMVDIGCAEGYYAVGFALASPRSRIHAFDIDPGARAMCAKLADDNGVSDRITISSEFKGDDFAKFGPRTLIFIDAEGAEDDLLNPDAYPALRRLTIIVETHPFARPGVTDRLRERFAGSHDVTLLIEESKRPPPDGWLNAMPTVEQFYATWEWRMHPTPWLVMRPRRQD